MPVNQPRHVLLAEDNPHDVELTIEALATYNLANAIEVVSDGGEALDYLRCRGKHAGRTSGNPAVVLLDIKMPKVDGLAVLREIKASEDLRTIPVVMLTSSREEQDLIAGYESGANAFVVKPVDFPAFLEAVRRLGVFWVLVNEPPVIAAGADKD
jgi:CheY-like chemotaxis protein